MEKIPGELEQTQDLLRERPRSQGGVLFLRAGGSFWEILINMGLGLGLGLRIQHGVNGLMDCWALFGQEGGLNRSFALGYRPWRPHKQRWL